MNRIAFILDQFELQSAGQQLLDRFLIGYNADGDFRKPEAQVTVFAQESGDAKLMRQRTADFGLRVANSIDSALDGANAVVVASGSKANPGAIPLERVISQVPTGARVYVDAPLLNNASALEKIEQLSKARSIVLASSSIASHFFPLPAKPEFRASDVTKAVIVAQGSFPLAERQALHGLAPYVDCPKLRLRDVRPIKNSEVWSEAYSPAWRDLFASAVSRSNTIQGDPEKDGRTQNIVGLQLVEKLAREPRGWLVRHEDGPEMLILMLDGALADFNFAVSAGPRIHSTQLFRAPTPLEDHYSGLAGWIERFIDSRQPGDALSATRYVLRAVDQMTTVSP
jgi:hypothetical protein